MSGSTISVTIVKQQGDRFVKVAIGNHCCGKPHFGAIAIVSKCDRSFVVVIFEFLLLSNSCYESSVKLICNRTDCGGQD